jgi:hypothetical protein
MTAGDLRPEHDLFAQQRMLEQALRGLAGFP